MQYRLRAAVKYALNEENVIFRLGDVYLPVSSPSFSSWMPSLLRHLREPVCTAELHSLVGSAHHVSVDRLIQALDGAGMLTKAESDSTLRYVAEERRYAEAISRAERLSQNPVASFRQARKAQTLIVGRADLVEHLAELAVRSGSQNLTIATHRHFSCEDFTDHLSGTTSDLLPSVDATDLEGFCASIRTAENIIVVCHTSNNLDPKLWDAIRNSDRTRLTRALLLVVQDEGAALATLWRPGVFPCEACVCRHLFGFKSVSGPRNAEAISGDFKIAAALAVQRLWDAATGLSDSDEDFITFQVGMSADITRHVMRASCVRCTHEGQMPDETWVNDPDVSRPLSLEAFLMRTAQLLVDPETGTIEQLGEYDLIQFPLHQSAVKLCIPTENHETSVWIVETGEDIYDARVSAIRSGVETWLLRRVEQSRRQEKQADSKPEPDTVVAKNNPSGWTDVTSALSYASTLADGLGRTFAAYANTLPDWTYWNGPHDKEARVSYLLRTYLEDILAWREVTIQVYTGQEAAGITVLRFCYRDKVISVVTGMAEQDVYTKGLADICSWIGWQDSSISAEGHLQIPRFRSDKKFRSLPFDHLEPLQARLGVRLHHFPLDGVITHFAEPFRFVFVTLEPVGDGMTHIESGHGNDAL